VKDSRWLFYPERFAGRRLALEGCVCSLDERIIALDTLHNNSNTKGGA
jgi:hypothetical protein